MAAVEQYLQHRQEILTLLKKELSTARNQMKQMFDRSDKASNVGDMVHLKVKKVSTTLFLLLLPPSWALSTLGHFL